MILVGGIATSFVSTEESTYATILSAFRNPTGKYIVDPISWGENPRITHPDSLLKTLLTGIGANNYDADTGNRVSNILNPST